MSYSDMMFMIPYNLIHSMATGGEYICCMMWFIFVSILRHQLWPDKRQKVTCIHFLIVMICALETQYHKWSILLVFYDFMYYLYILSSLTKYEFYKYIFHTIVNILVAFYNDLGLNDRVIVWQERFGAQNILICNKSS